MAFEYYYRKGTKNLRCGYTTGTCAALASAAATELLLTGKAPGTVSLMTGKGIPVEVLVEKCGADDNSAWAAIPKDAGDDADVTDGLDIVATVQKQKGSESGQVRVTIDGGKGVGRVTKPGLDQPVGAAAINSGPRTMIEEEVRKVCEECGYSGGIHVKISVPEGEEAAKRTFNANLGIEGGISILGTTGIVEPMSEQALVDTIEVTLRQIAAESKKVIMTPGNYGNTYIKEQQLDQLGVPVLNISNFLGESLDMASAEKMEEVLLVAHVGKLSKVAAGIMNTHSRYADGRNEVFAAHAGKCGASPEVIGSIMNAATTDACIDILDGVKGSGEQGNSFRDEVMESILDAVQKKLDHRAAGAYRIGAVMFSNVYGTLGMTDVAKELLENWGKY